jgi:drug/metabolite transporter (DMT)-like permease
MCLIWGVPYLLIRVAVRDVAPGTLVFLRTAIGGLVLLPLALRRGGFGPVLGRWRPLVAFTVLEVAIPWLLLSDAERHLSSSLSGLLIAAVPLVGVVIARLTGSNDRADLLQLLGLGVGLVGVAMLVGLDFGRISAGPLLEILAVVIGYAVAPVIMTRTLADLPTIPVVCSSLLLAAVGYLPYAAMRPPTHVADSGWLSIAVLGLVCTAVAFVLFFALIAEIGPARATVITYVNPAVAVIGGVLLLGEDFTLGLAVGFPLILAGSVLGARKRIAAPRLATEPVDSDPLAAGPLVAGPSPEAAMCTTVDQSMRTLPDAVSKTAATSPVPSSDPCHSSSMPSSGWCADVPR